MKITIASGKGGTGKTTISTNLSAYLSEKGKNVLLLDLDVEEPNSALFFDIVPVDSKKAEKMVPVWEFQNCTLCGKCAEICAFNAIVALSEEIIVYPELCHSCYACSELCPKTSLPMHPVRIGEIRAYKTEGFDFVEGRLDLGQEMAVPLIAQTIEYAERNYADAIKIFDAPPGTSCPVIEASKESDFVLLVTEPTPFGLNDLILAVETMKILGKKFGVVINRYHVENNNIEEYCEKEGIPVVAKIKNDKEVAMYYSKGMLIYRHVGHFRKSMGKIIEFLEGLQ